jgi:rhodanese-related sulfurtransferase
MFVAEQGPGVQVVDIRPRDQATGVLGYIPGSTFLSTENLMQLAKDGVLTVPLVVVGTTGDSAARVARELEQLGFDHVAAMAGGLASWRAQGFATSRSPDGVRETFFSSQETTSSEAPLTLERVREHIGDPRSVRWIKISSMIAHKRLSCIDGRDERGVIGSPGGDGGEFLLGLAAIERVTGRELDEATVEAGLLLRLDLFGNFYMHTDVHAFEALIESLRADPRLQGVAGNHTTTEEWYEFVQSPPDDLSEILLEHLVDPAHIGCGHIRLMLQHGEEYGIRSDLVIYFLRAFHRLWWKGSPEILLTVLAGDHEESAVVNVRLADGVWGLSQIPLISPALGRQQVFVNHPDVSAHLRQNVVQSVVRSSGPLGVDASHESELQAAVNDLASHQLGVTVGYLARGLPVFDVVFADDGSFEVHEATG